MPLFGRFWKKDDDESSGDEVEDASAEHLSYVGTAAYDVLRKKYNHFHHELWNVSHGNKWIGKLHQTPLEAFVPRATHDFPTLHHDEWFPEKIGEIIGRTEEWCDILSLAPPDGKFLTAFQNGLKTVVQNADTFGGRITIRIMFGNIVGMPVNCDAVIKSLTKDLPADADKKIRLWVGSWRKDVSWNHAKIIAVDGKYLWTGGHNFWDAHYLQKNAVNDLSLELEGPVASDAHYFANAQWGYIVKKQSTGWGKFVDKHIPDSLDVPRRARVTVSDWPAASTAEFPPYYKKKKLLHTMSRIQMVSKSEDGDELPDIPVLTLGRYGKLLKQHRPSDAAFVAMIDSAKTIVRFVLQDLGPVSLPGTKLALPGCTWPREYMDAMARVLWTKHVDLEIVLSNPGSIPGDLSPTEAQYGNGWSCNDVAAEIIKSIKTQFPDAPDGDLRLKVQDNLRLCFLRLPNGSTKYSDGGNVGLHSKHFIVDDRCCYIGSQNLYICDLAEWGVIIDHPESVDKMMDEYWRPMWKASFLNQDVVVDEVMDGLKIDRSAPSKLVMTQIQLEKAKEAMRANYGMSTESTFYHKGDKKLKQESANAESNTAAKQSDGWASSSDDSEAEA